MAVNIATLVNFGGDLNVGDWTYSVIPRNAPAYLPLTNNAVSYLQSSYPVLTSLLASNNKFTSTPTLAPITTATPTNSWIAAVSGNGVFIAPAYAESYSSGGASYYIMVNSAALGANNYNVYNIAPLVSLIPAAAAYGNNLFAIVGGQSPPNSPYNIMAYANSTSVSTSGSWISRTLPDSQAWSGIAYDSNTNVWVAIAANYANTARSTDAMVTWSRGGSPAPTVGSSIAAGNSIFVCTPPSGSTVGIYSIDGGVTWANTSFPRADNWSKIAYGNGVFVAISSNSSTTTAASSTNAITWTMLNNLPTDMGYAANKQLNYIAYAPATGIWAIASNIAANTTNLYKNVAFGSDLQSWTSISVTNVAGTGSLVDGIGYNANNQWHVLTRTSVSRFIATANSTAFTLPLVTSQWGAFPYIKAS